MSEAAPVSDDVARNFENATDFFGTARELQADHPDLLDILDEVEAGSNVVLKAAAFLGKLFINVDGAHGSGSCDAHGGGSFVGRSIKAELRAAKSGQYEAWFERYSCKVVFKDNGGKVIAPPFVGIGLQKGISNRGGKPWVGNWKV